MFFLNLSAIILVNVFNCLVRFSFKNRPNMSFDDVSVEADQTFDLVADRNAEVEYQTKYLNLKNYKSQTYRVYNGLAFAARVARVNS